MTDDKGDRMVSKGTTHMSEAQKIHLLMGEVHAMARAGNVFELVRCIEAILFYTRPGRYDDVMCNIISFMYAHRNSPLFAKRKGGQRAK